MPKIIYNKLWFKNGLAYKSCSMPLDNQGLVLLRGLNIDDGGFLGAGKTSPFEIFSTLQVGKGGKNISHSGRTKANDIINIHTKGDFEAHLLFSVDDVPYELIQYRQHSQHGNTTLLIDKTNGNNILPSGAARTKAYKWISEYLTGLDDRSLFSLVYLPQDYNNSILTGTDTERQQSLIRMFGLDIYDKLYENVKAELATIKVILQDANKLERELEDINAAIESYGSSVEEMEKELDKFRKESERLSKEVKTGQRKIQSLKNRLQKVKRRKQLEERLAELELSEPIKSSAEFSKELLDKANETLSHILKNIATLENTYEKAQRAEEIQEILKSITSDREVEDVRHELSKVQSDINQTENVDIPNAENRQKIYKELQALGPSKFNLEQLRKLWKKTASKEAKIKQELEDKTGRINNDICPTCHRPFNLDKNEVEELKNEIKLLREQLLEVTQTEHKLSKAIKAEEKRNELKVRLESIPKVDKSIEELRQILSSLKEQEKELKKELRVAGQKHILEVELNSLPVVPLKDIAIKINKAKAKAKKQRDIVSAITSALEIKKELADLPTGEIEQIEAIIRKTELRLQRVQDSKSEADVMVGRLISNIERFEELLTRKTKIVDGLAKIADMAQKAKCLEALKKAFGSKGLKHIRFERILSEAVENTVPRYTDILWPKRNVHLAIVPESSGIRISMARENSQNVESHLFSGGERTKAGLALLFGIRDLKEIYTGTTTNLLVVDEPFSNLDPQGTANLLSVLKFLKSRIGTIVVIGNQRDVFVHEHMFDKVWWAVRENNISTLYTDGLPARYNNYLNSSLVY